MYISTLYIVCFSLIILETTVVDFTKKAYMTWMLKDNFFNMLKKTTLDVHIKFRTRDPDGGVLLHLPSNSYEFISLQVRYFY